MSEVEVIQPYPLPASFNVQTPRGDDGSLVVILQVFTGVGQAIYFLDAETASKVGRMLIEAATGIILPGVDQIRQNGRYTPPKGRG